MAWVDVPIQKIVFTVLRRKQAPLLIDLQLTFILYKRYFSNFLISMVKKSSLT
jgi:hypothetical protein